MKLRPLFILADLEAGGAQRVILTVVRHLNREIFDPHLAVIRSRGPLLDEIPPNTPIHDLKAERVRYALPGILRLSRVLRPETIVSTLGHLNLSILACKCLFPRTTRLIVREANTPSIRLRYTAHPGAYRFLYRRLYPLADRVICNSAFMEKDMVAFSSPRPVKTDVIPNPVDLGRIRARIPRSENPYRKKNVSHFLAVGRLNYQKGFDLLLKAFKKALEAEPALHLTIVGEGPEEASLKGFAERSGFLESIIFSGLQDNPYPYMAHADLLVSSSRWEGSPNVVLEALACGTPVLAFDCPGGTSEIIRDGENGWLVPLADVDAMSRKMLIVARGEGSLTGTKDSYLPSEFHCENVVGKYENLLLSG